MLLASFGSFPLCTGKKPQ